MAELPRAELPLPRGVLGDGPGKPHGFVTILGWCGERVELIPAFRDLGWVACGFQADTGARRRWTRLDLVVEACR